jgi:hypothetical protein
MVVNLSLVLFSWFIVCYSPKLPCYLGVAYSSSSPLSRNLIKCFKRSLSLNSLFAVESCYHASLTIFIWISFCFVCKVKWMDKFVSEQIWNRCQFYCYNTITKKLNEGLSKHEPSTPTLHHCFHMDKFSGQNAMNHGVFGFSHTF